MALKFGIILLLLIALGVYLQAKQKPLPLVQTTNVIGQNIKLFEKPFAAKTPTLEQIFEKNHTITAALPAKKIRTLIATGDIIPARSVNFQTVSRKDFRWPYLKTAETLAKADITFINLETPLIENCPLTQEGMVFCGNSKNIEGLVYSGVDIVNLANNHAGNYGEKGVESTKSLLNVNGITVTGANETQVLDIRGIKFAFLGYNDVTKPQPGIFNVDEEKIKADILEAKRQAEVIIVTFHWGAEYKDQPDERQKYLGHLAIDAGADLIIGNHPHWIQPVEIYKEKLITYAHGNFVFDQMWSQKTKEGVVGRYTFYDKDLIDVEFFPIQIENYGQPIFLSGDKKSKILEDMKLQSKILAKN